MESKCELSLQGVTFPREPLRYGPRGTLRIPLAEAVTICLHRVPEKALVVHTVLQQETHTGVCAQRFQEQDKIP